MKRMPTLPTVPRTPRRLSTATSTIADTIQRALTSAGLGRSKTAARVDGSSVTTPPSGVAAREQPGTFVSRVFSNAAGTRAYKLYIPEHFSGKSTPLIVMLHGCMQDPDDFAAGTRMNRLADKEGFLVVYPAQSRNANGSNCWNWFDPAHQTADHGEPSLIAGITREVASMYPVDEHRIFVAGLSAGAAMAVVLGAGYPELFAAVGAHSGLPYGAAHDMPSAFAAMRGSRRPIAAGTASGQVSKPRTAKARATPTIVFHGDRDTTVNPINGSAIVTQALTQADGPLKKTVHERKSANGREYTATTYRDSARPHIEQWVLHGAGHAWSGGSSDGSYTDVTGPDATAQMLRFFQAQVRR